MSGDCAIVSGLTQNDIAFPLLYPQGTQRQQIVERAIVC